MALKVLGAEQNMPHGLFPTYLGRIACGTALAPFYIGLHLPSVVPKTFCLTHLQSCASPLRAKMCMFSVYRAAVKEG